MPTEFAAASASKDIHVWEAVERIRCRTFSLGERETGRARGGFGCAVGGGGSRTRKNSLRLYDQAIEHLTLAGAQAGC